MKKVICHGAINLAVYELLCNAKKVLKDKNSIIIVYCSVGIRSKKAIRILEKLGYKNLYNLKSGIEG